jgi:uncharacterized protein YigE (DUF2233 family)
MRGEGITAGGQISFSVSRQQREIRFVRAFFTDALLTAKFLYIEFNYRMAIHN